MKKVLLTLTLTGFVASVMAQGTINFNNNVTGQVRAPVYGPETPDNTVSKTGNTTAGVPAGTQVYTGGALSGTSGAFVAQLFATAGSVADASALAPQGALSTFRTGTAAGFFSGQTIVLSGIAGDAPLATGQVRVWNNPGNQYPTWAAAQVAWQEGLIAAGVSEVFAINAIGGAINPPSTLTGLRSFNVYFIPEPTSFALAGLAGAAMLIFRRRN